MHGVRWRRNNINWLLGIVLHIGDLVVLIRCLFYFDMRKTGPYALLVTALALMGAGVSRERVIGTATTSKP